MRGIKLFDDKSEAQEHADGCMGWPSPAMVEDRQYGDGVTLYAVRIGDRYLRADGLVE